MTEVICDGDSIVIGTSVYTTSGSYSDTLATYLTCDSIVNLELTVNPVLEETLTEVICDGDSIVIGTSVYTTSGSYSDTLATYLSCDSIVNLDLTVNPVSEETLSEVICDG